MENKLLKNIGFDFEDNYYELGFSIDEVRAVSNYSKARGGNFKNEEFLKLALKKYSDVSYISDKKAKDINDFLREHTIQIEVSDGKYDELSYIELIAYVTQLFLQAVEVEASKVSPATITIENDNTVTINSPDFGKYKLMYVRETLEEVIQYSRIIPENIFELFLYAETLIELGLQHYQKRISPKLAQNLFLSVWATQNNEETKDDLTEMLNALIYHMGEVLDSGIKKSKAVIKAKTR